MHQKKIIKVKRQPMEGKEMFANHMSDKCLIFRIYNELLQSTQKTK